MSVGLRNTKKAMTWIKSEPSYDAIVEKIQSVELHIEKFGRQHPSYSDFSNVLFLLKQEQVRVADKGDHLQRSMFCEQSDPVQAVSSASQSHSRKVKAYDSDEARHASFKRLKVELDTMCDANADKASA